MTCCSSYNVRHSLRVTEIQWLTNFSSERTVSQQGIATLGKELRDGSSIIYETQVKTAPVSDLCMGNLSPVATANDAHITTAVTTTTATPINNNSNYNDEYNDDN